MICTFENITVTDHSKSIQDADYFLITQQNRQYVTDIPKEKIITPQDLINRYRLDTLKTIGVTGTNGKTTTAAAIYSYLNDLGLKAALQGTRGFFIEDEQLEKKSLTTPPILQTLYHMYTAKQQGATYFVMEVSSHAIAQNRIEDLQFALKVFTNISQDHLDYHKTMQNYIATKSSFFMDEGSKLINKDDKHIQYNPKGARTYSVEELATYQILAFSMQNGISAVLRFGNEMIDFHAPMIGLFNLYNVTAAISAVHMLTNLPLQQICEVTEHFAGVKGRMQILNEEPLIIVDFAHTPDGMQKVFESFPGKKLVAIFGAGGDRDRSKRALMGNVASRFCTKIYLTSDNPRSEDPKQIIEDIAKGIETDVFVEKIVDRKEAVEKAFHSLQKDEILLILGKGDEEYIEQNGTKIPYSDVEVVTDIIEDLNERGT
ncbi:UDP-N-acetylmuramoyl-L-alanyl-D-glutamate--2,6-diaminopimelate ligase [Nitratiruptor sp. SB155-2]|uniref:UDP-N-acetylmuramoyl-L-alanyl-D-glutamate--2, 6-diaminopimelate ligase n=1 Tax=Nitratiruptor sp. (strain SB155-2) TaxID=387092 RepID=UPI0001586D6C|nr:UDP-N-acetylmuramoyl-L-alanyl-D-glutamate--2,6-diaminopimelate ligase [Nitratiruptor sp. SB155-2]BAF69367.1 UDP-N-acetylmuramoylananine-D-glutamate-2,6-diaminopimelate ligase [Nitratiruptor sp. SB155-2]